MAYEDVLLALVACNVNFVVTGGVAMQLHGMDRQVPDLDIVVDPALANLALVERCLAQLGFWPTVPLPLSTVVVMRTIDAEGREVDINRLYELPFVDLRTRAASVEVRGTTILVMSRDDLLAVKRRRGRDYDLDDVRFLEARRQCAAGVRR
jgi:hypothetical protein